MKTENTAVTGLSCLKGQNLETTLEVVGLQQLPAFGSLSHVIFVDQRETT